MNYPYLSQLFVQRWWIYQRERFPILSYSLLILAFASVACGYPALLLGQNLSWSRLLTVFIVFFCSFLQLRIADEFKDYEQDCRYRPHRPVPRGLIQLWELQILEMGTLIIQFMLTLNVGLLLLIPLSCLWFYQFFMRQEFFIRDWLRAHPLAYLLSHNLVLPLMSVYGILSASLSIADLWHWEFLLILLLSSSNGMVIEIGRKIRAPQEEELDGETYSQWWGRDRATLIWLAVVIGSGILSAIAAYRIAWEGLMIAIVSGFVSAFCWISYQFINHPNRRTQKQINLGSSSWVLISYSSLGLIPWLMTL